MPSAEKQDLDIGPSIRGAATEQKLFGRYTLKRVLGRGGMGIVWLAHDDELLRYVAMKFLPDMLVRDREAVEDLKRETRRSLDLTHHHIVRIYDFTQDEMCAAIIMEFVDGETLSAMKSQQPGGCFGVSVLAPWVAHFASGIDYAHHQARVVHRDLKPANLMINSRGDLKVTDFGISRSMSDSMTRVSVSNTAGTLAYMSPEQALGAPPAPCDDIYAFGATIYDLLTGRPPFFRGNLQVQLETVIPPLMEDRRAELGNSGEPIPALWEEVIASCLAKRPQDRPQGVAEAAAMLGLSGTSAGARLTTSPGGIIEPSTGITRTRASSTDDAATAEQVGSATPKTAKPSTNRPTNTPRPTGMDDIFGGASIRDERPIVPPQARTVPKPATESAPSATVPPEDLTCYGQAPLAPEPAPPSSKAAPQSRSADEAPPEQAESPSVSTFAPDRTPARKSSSGLAVAALASIALVAIGGAWFFLKPGAPKPVVAPVAIVQPAQPAPEAPPNYDSQIADIRKLITDERVSPASELLAKLPPDLPIVATLRTEIATAQAALSKREAAKIEMSKRSQSIEQLIRDSDAALAKSDWEGARLPLKKVLSEFDAANTDATTRLAKIDTDEKRMALERDEDKLRSILASAGAALATDDFAGAKRILETAPPSQAGNADLLSLTASIDKARTAAMNTAPPPPAPTPVIEVPDPPKTTPSKPKGSTAQTSRPKSRSDDDDTPPRSQPASAKTSARPPQPVVSQKKEAPAPPVLPPKKKPSSVNRGTNIGG